jgi:iron complex outermembrane recepter protein
VRVAATFRSPWRAAGRAVAAGCERLRDARIAATRIAVAMCLASVAAAEEPAPPLALEPVVVTASRLPQPLTEVGASVSVVEKLDIQGAQKTVGLEEALDRVPGVLVQSSQDFAQDVRIQIRGFGTRSPFGIREIKVLMDGIPITEPDGQTQLDDVDLGAIQSIEVLRGPAGALYGNASGGVIEFFTEDAPPVPTAEVILSGGSYGFGKYQLKGGGRAGKAHFFLDGSYMQLDGYRDHSATQSGNFTGKLRYDVDDATDVMLLVTAVDSPEAQDPGALTRQDADDHPRRARDLNVQLDDGEEVQQVRVGTVAHHRREWSDLSAYAYYVYRNFDSNQPIPPPGDGVVTFERNSPGTGARWAYRQPVLGWQQTFSVGFDFQYQDDDRRRFQNIDGQRGALGLHQFERVTSVGPYVRQAVYLRDDLELNAGARYDWIQFNVDVDQPPDTPSATRTFDHWSPAGGLRWTWLHGKPAGVPELSLYANIGTAFQTPTTTELDNPDGPGFNPNVQPQTSITYEIGARAERSERFNAGVAGYLIDIDDELIPFESPLGRTAFRNAGRSRRYGAEIDWQARLLGPLRWSGAITLLDAHFVNYTVDQQSFDGNEEPGIPSWWIYQELAYLGPAGLFAAIEAFFVDGYFVNDANTAFTTSYALVNLRAGYEHHFGDHWTVAPFLGLNNLANVNYDGTVRLNALGGRFFEPAPGFNVYGGIAVTATL